MPEEIKEWEYRVQIVGSAWSGIKDSELEALLNEWGEEGWDVVSVHPLTYTYKVNVVAKRPLTDRVKRRRSMPSYSNR